MPDRNQEDTNSLDNSGQIKNIPGAFPTCYFANLICLKIKAFTMLENTGAEK